MSVDKQIGDSADNDVEVVDVFKIDNSEALVGLVAQLDEQQLRYLNRLAVHRIKQMTQHRVSAIMNNFATGDFVWFQSYDGRMVEGTVVRLNKKTVTVSSFDGNLNWNVSPALLRRLDSPPKAR